MKRETRKTTDQVAATAQMSAVEAARGMVEAARTALAHWEAESAAAVAELESLQERAGGEVMDNPDGAVGLSKQMQELRDRADIARRAIAAAGPRVVAAEATYLNAEADALEPAVADAKATLATHEKRTVQLLKALEDHEGKYVPEVELIAEQRASSAFGGPTRWDVPKSELLELSVLDAERPVLLLRAMAEGVAPSVALRSGETAAEVYPACVWGPEALIPAPAYVAWRNQQSIEVETLKEFTIPQLQEQAARLEEQHRVALEHLGAYANATDVHRVPDGQSRRVWQELRGETSFNGKTNLTERLQSAKAELATAERDLVRRRELVEAS